MLQEAGGKRVRFGEGRGLFEDDMSLDFHRSIDTAADRLKLNCPVGVGGSIGVGGSGSIGVEGSIGVGGISEHAVKQEGVFCVKMTMDHFYLVR